MTREQVAEDAADGAATFVRECGLSPSRPPAAAAIRVGKHRGDDVPVRQSRRSHGLRRRTARSHCPSLESCAHSFRRRVAIRITATPQSPRAARAGESHAASSAASATEITGRTLRRWAPAPVFSHHALKAAISNWSGSTVTVYVFASDPSVGHYGLQTRHDLRSYRLLDSHTLYKGTIHDFVLLNALHELPETQSALRQSGDAIRGALSR